VIPALIKSWPANYPGRASFEIIPPWVLVRGRLTVTYLTAGAGYFSLPSASPRPPPSRTALVSETAHASAACK